MSKIPYQPELSPAKNMFKLKEHLGLSTVQLAKQIGHVNPQVLNNTVKQNFKTANGNETERTLSIKTSLSTFFSNGIPENISPKTKEDLFALMGCASCDSRTKTHKGCYKFCLTKEDINKGPFINTHNHGAFTLSEHRFCPYAPLRSAL